MNAAIDLAAQLRDVHAPPDPLWWPPAPGWWVALLICVILLAAAISYARPWWRRWRMRRRLLAALEAIARRHRAGAIETATAAEVSQLLRRAVLERFPQSRAAGLVGADWIAFLAARDGASSRFGSLHGALTVAPYGPPGTNADAASLLREARGWLRAVI